MILQALHEYYLRKATDSDSGIAPEGMERKEIPFIIVIDNQGNFIDFHDKKGKIFLVPKGEDGRTNTVKPNLLWDHYGYVLGFTKSTLQKDIDKTIRQHIAFVDRLNVICKNFAMVEEVQAILKFYEKEQIKRVFEHSNWKNCMAINNCNLSFKIVGDKDIIAEKEMILSLMNSTLTSEKDNCVKSRCLVTGRIEPIARLHTEIKMKGLNGQVFPKTLLVNFQKQKGYDSYGKVQGYNAPVSITAKNGYSTALKTLISSKQNSFMVGDMTLVFWAEKITEFENYFSFIFDTPPSDDPDRNTKAVRNLYESLYSGKLNTQEDNKFYILGLSPANKARICVRFWKRGTVKDFAEKIKQHFDDLEIIQRDGDIAHFPLRLVLQNIALNEKDDKIPPNLAGDMVRSIIEGLPYPAILLNSCINRIRAEQSRKNKNGKPVENVNCIRASILKAYINRQIRSNRLYNKQEKELLMSLDRDNKSTAYRLGRLFATLEKIQEDAQPGINATIRDRFYSSASSCPSSAFPLLIRLKNAHLNKLHTGQKINYEKQIGEIMDGIPPKMPAHLNLNQQATFAVGYYHQKQSFYLKK
ncbi:MAG: type I-C CRISPR-associated protein Cas8c/Csd1 [Desulfamplus sp.]|nr:type I-C CRISPR-associated protein Cas8c/Csd1 [Desulfamplus sp.]